MSSNVVGHADFLRGSTRGLWQFLLLILCVLPTSVHAQEVVDAPVCAEPVSDESGQPDPEVDRALHTVVPLIMAPSRAWRFGASTPECDGAARVRFRGHRQPQVHFVVEVQLPGQPTMSLSVDAPSSMGTFAVAEALCVNALLLLGQPTRPRVESRRDLRLWLGPSTTVGDQIAVFGSELGVEWVPRRQVWLAASVGFEAFGSGANTLGKFEYSALQTAVLGGWRWQLGRMGVAAGLGLRHRTWLSHLQTLALHEHYDVGLAIAGELRASVHVSRPLRIGLAWRPSLGLDDVIVAAPDEPELFRVPRFLMQFALEVAVEL